MAAPTKGIHTTQRCARSPQHSFHSKLCQASSHQTEKVLQACYQKDSHSHAPPSLSSSPVPLSLHPDPREHLSHVHRCPHRWAPARTCPVLGRQPRCPVQSPALQAYPREGALGVTFPALPRLTQEGLGATLAPSQRRGPVLLEAAHSFTSLRLCPLQASGVGERPSHWE